MTGRRKPIPKSGATLSLSDAARATDRHVQTIRRQLDLGRLPGALLDDRGRWKVPIADLEALGYKVELTQLESNAVADDRVAHLEGENRRLREKLAVAEALAAERLRLLDALTSGTAKRRR
jgi:hypothetical protein